MTMPRRDFLRQSLALSGSAVAFGVLAAHCGDDDAGPKSGGDCAAKGTAVAIGSNHGHALVVSEDDVSAGVEKTYTIQGAAIHGHDLTITAADFAKLADNVGIEVTSTSTSDHAHAVTVNCA